MTVASAVNASTTGYTIQTGNFTTTKNTASSGGFAGEFNNSATEVGFFANQGSGQDDASAFQTFTTTGVGTSGTARPLQVGDNFSITMFSASNPFGFEGVYFDDNNTYSSFSNYNTNERTAVVLGSSGNWIIENNGTSVDTGIAANNSVTAAISITSSNTFNMTITNNSNSSSTTYYDLVMKNAPGTSARIQSFSLIDQNDQQQNFYVKNGSLSNTNSVTIGGSNLSLTVSGVITDGLDSASTSTTSVNSLTKIGTGTMTLTGANSYSGGTTVNNGTLAIRSDGNLGAVPGSFQAANITLNGGGLSVDSSGTFNVSLGSNRGITIGSNGGSVSAGTGANSSLTINGAVVDNAGAGQSFFLSGSNAVTVAGNISGAGLVQVNGSNVTFSGTNSNTGGTQINSGAVLKMSGGQLQSQTTGALADNGTLDLNGTSQTVASASFSGAGASSNGALTNSSNSASTLTLNSGSSLTAATSIGGTGNITLNGAGALTAGSVTTLTKVGNDILSLSNGAGVDNTNVHLAVNAGTVILNKTGTTVNGGSGIHAVGEVDISSGGTVQLAGSGGGEIYDGNVSTVSSGGVLDLNGQNQSFTGTGNLTINGTGISSQGALVNTNTGAASTLTGPVVLGSNSSIGGAGSFTISGVVSGGTNTLTKVGAGTVTLSGSSADTYTGLTTISGGELDLNKTAGVNAIAGDGVTTTNDVTVSGGTLKWLANEQVGDTTTITVSSGTVDLNGKTETLGTLINNGGTFTTNGSGTGGHLIGTTASVQFNAGTSTITSGGIVEDGHITIAGGTNTVQGGATEGLLHLLSGGVGLQMTGSTLTLNSDATNPGRLLLDGNVSTSASSTIAVIASGGNALNPGVVDTDTGTRTFTVASGTTPNGIDLSIQAKVTDSASISKAGAGAMELTGNNTYAGGTTITAGTLVVNNSAGSGTGSGAVMVNAGTLAGSGSISGAVIMSNTGSNNLAPGASPIPGSIATLHVGALTMQSTSTLKIDILAGGSNTGAGAGSIYDSVISGGNVALNNAALAVSALSSSLAIGDKYFIVENSTNSADAYGTFASGSTVTDNSGDVFAINYADNGDGGLTANDISLTVISVVPEPSTWVIGGLAAALLIVQIVRARSFSKRTERS